MAGTLAAVGRAIMIAGGAVMVVCCLVIVRRRLRRRVMACQAANARPRRCECLQRDRQRQDQRDQ
jgi:hypothetical protein